MMTAIQNRVCLVVILAIGLLLVVYSFSQPDKTPGMQVHTLPFQSNNNMSKYFFTSAGVSTTTNSAMNDLKKPVTSSTKLNNLSTPLLSSSYNELSWIATSNGHNIFSAYYDSRSAVSKRPSVILIGYGNEPTSLFCYFKYSDGHTKCVSKPVQSTLVSSGAHIMNIRYSPRYYYCNLTLEDKSDIPTLVAVSTSNTCASSNTSGFIHVQNRSQNISQLKTVGICVGSPLVQNTDSRDQLQQLVEFIEMIRALGGESLTLYSMNATTWLIDTLLKRYRNSNKLSLDIIQWRIFKAWKPLHYYGQTLVINDCVYRNMYRVKYLAVMDLDEMIYPTKKDWMWLMEEFDKEKNTASFTILNKFFLQGDTKTINTRHALNWKLCNSFTVPTYFNWTTKSLVRSTYSYRTKFFLKPQYVIDTCIHGVCQHYPGYKAFNVPESLAFLAHYRRKVLPEYDHSPTTADRTALRYKEKVMVEMSSNCP